MAISGPGWEGVDVAWDWLQYDREVERRLAREEAEQLRVPETEDAP